LLVGDIELNDGRAGAISDIGDLERRGQRFAGVKPS